MTKNFGTHDNLQGCCPANPLREVRTDEDILDFAERLSRDVLETTGDVRVAESTRKLLVACTALLRDWFGEKDYTLCGMNTLLSMALMRGKYDTNVSFSSRKSPLDFMFLQIERGVKYVKNDAGEWGLQKSKLVRKADGARPGMMGGMPWGTDTASAFYAAWRTSASPDVLEESVYACIAQVSGLGLRSAA